MILKDVWKDKVNNKDIILAEDINNIANAVIANEKNKVDKEDGKGLSTNDYTDEDKERLENTVGEKSVGENSAIFGSSTNKIEELKLPDKIYYKPIAEEYYDGTENNPRYKFENLTFTTDTNDTQLFKLYTYTDKWGNKCYTVYKDYTPDIANGSTNNTDGTPRVSKVYELTEDKDLANSQPTVYMYDTEGMLQGLRYEALFNKGTYFAVAEGENSFSSGKDNVASGDDTFSVGYINIVLADGSTALGRRLLVRGVGANGFGLGGKVTGRYAIAFNESGLAIGYASVVFGDHCKSLGYCDVTGGFKSNNYGRRTFIYGTECVADKDVQNSFGGGDKIHIYKGFDDFLWGKELECTGNYNGITGAFHNIIGDSNLVGGNKNNIGSSDNLVGGINHTVQHYERKDYNGRAIISGAGNILEAGWGAALLGYHLHNITGNHTFMTGLDNTNSGLCTINGGQGNNSNGIYNVLLGSYLTALEGHNVMLGENLEAENSRCNLIGGYLKATGSYKTILGRYNAPSDNPFVVACGNASLGRKNIFEVTDKGKTLATGYEGEYVILKSPDGKKKLKLTINDNGELVTEGV